MNNLTLKNKGVALTMKVLFYSLFDISHEEDKTTPIFFHDKLGSDEQTNNNIRDVIEFADSTIQEADELTKVRDYYFESEDAEVISQIKKILRLYIDESFLEERINEKLLTISKRYAREEKDVIENKSQLNTPAPSNLFYVLSKLEDDNEEEGRFHFFIAKIEKSEFLHSESDSSNKIFRLIQGLPHKSGDKKKSDKSWKTASIYISYQVDKNEEAILDIERVIISDTNNTIAVYWSKYFLEATEVTDDEKNTLSAYTEVRKIINNLNRSKDKTPQRAADVNHLTNALNSYFLNNEAFDFEKMIESVFSPSYAPACSNLDMQSLYNKAVKLKDSGKFDNNFSIIQKVVEDKAKQTIKISDKIDIRVNKHSDDLNDIISSEVDEFGNPFIKIKVDSKENEAYIKFINRETIKN